MTLVVALEDIDPEYVNRPGKTDPGSPGAVNTRFLRSSATTPNAPHASLNRYLPGKARHSAAHFHQVDQFQIIMEGKGTFGRHSVMPYCVHFSRTYTPYGPLLSDTEGWAFLVLRTRHDPGAQRFPESYEKLKQIPDRRPWQITTKVEFPPQNVGVNLRPIPEIADDQGLFTATLTMAPHAKTIAPDPAQGEGQYVVIVKGSLMHEGRERRAPTVVFIRPDERAFQIESGAQGLEAIIMNFPKVMPRTVDSKTPSSVAGFKKWQCELCSFAYDEALGMPGEGIAPGTRWADVPETWNCPDCAANKSDFHMVEV